MKFKSKLIPAALLCAWASVCYADSKVIVESPNEGESPKEVGLDVNTKISFTSSGVQIDNGGNVSSFPFSEVGKIRFKTSAVSVGAVAGDMEFALRNNPVGAELEITGYKGTPVALTVSSLNGGTLIVNDAWQGESVDVSTLTPGVYLLTVNNETIKFIKK